MRETLRGRCAFVDRKSARHGAPDAADCARAGSAMFLDPAVAERIPLQTPQQLEVKAHDGETLYALCCCRRGASPEVCR